MPTVMSGENQIAEVVDRLKASYPTLPDDTVAGVVKDMQAVFTASRIREFVPLFVERRARAALTKLAE